MSEKSIPWKMIAVEAIAIVLSILLAFSIDTWWENRQNRLEERYAINRLITEFRENRLRLEDNRETFENALNATQLLLERMGPEGGAFESDSISIGVLLDECLASATYEPLLGTVNSLISSGRLHLISDERLQSMLAEWPSTVQDMIEWQKIELENTENLALPYTYDYVAWPDVDAELDPADRPSKFDSDYKSLLSSRLFEGIISNRRFNIRDIISDIEELEMKTQEILDILADQ